MLLLLVPLSAAAAEAVVRTMDLGSWRTWATISIVQLVVVAGYFASSLALWAEWVEGPLAKKLQLVQGLIAAMLAGNFAYFLAFHGDMPDIVAMLAAGAGGWGGDKFLGPLLQRVTDAVSAIAGGARKDNPNP